jgi:hypothetical protein
VQRRRGEGVDHALVAVGLGHRRTAIGVGQAEALADRGRVELGSRAHRRVVDGADLEREVEQARAVDRVVRRVGGEVGAAVPVAVDADRELAEWRPLAL